MNVRQFYRTIAIFGNAMRAILPTILSLTGAVGVAATGVSAAKAGYEDAALDISAGHETGEERAKRKISTYAKPIALGAASMACIFAGDRLHVKRYTNLAAAASLISDRYFNVKKELKTWHGKMVDDAGNETPLPEKTMQNRAVGLSDAAQAQKQMDNLRKQGIEPVDTHTGSDLWYEPFTKTFFLASPEHVQNAEYHTNRNFRLRGQSPFGEFLKFLELPAGDEPGYNLLHWDDYEGEAYYGYSWIDFVHVNRKLADGTEYKQIFYPFEPHLGEK